MLNKIVLYNGDGVSSQLQSRIAGLFPSIRLMTERQVLEENWEEETSLFILPGGRDLPYHEALKGEGNRKIRAFVEAGGSFLGICAGAYYASASVDFEQGTPLEICGLRELRFFNGAAKGPAYGLGQFAYGSEKGARLAKIAYRNTSYSVYYNGGPTFEGDFAHVEILAIYSDLPQTPPAILSCKVGKGRAILSGVHIETNPDLARELMRVFQEHGRQ